MVDDLAEAVRGNPEWYHTIELAPGVVTPGWFDTRAVTGALPFPVSLEGKRCLDVGTFDGFWAFEMERRGASEVIAVDVDDRHEWDWPASTSPSVIDEFRGRTPQGEGFRIAHAALRSKVRREACSVYDLDPDVVGTFDFVYVGSLLLHLRDPVRALGAVRSVCAGEGLVVDAIDLGLTVAFPRRPLAWLDGIGRPWWWKPNLAGLVRMLEAAGFVVEGRPRRFFMPPGVAQPRPRPTPAVVRHKEGRQALVRTWKGDPHAAVRVRPGPC